MCTNEAKEASVPVGQMQAVAPENSVDAFELRISSVDAMQFEDRLHKLHMVGHLEACPENVDGLRDQGTDDAWLEFAKTLPKELGLSKKAEATPDALALLEERYNEVFFDLGIAKDIAGVVAERMKADPSLVAPETRKPVNGVVNVSWSDRLHLTIKHPGAVKERKVKKYKIEVFDMDPETGKERLLYPGNVKAFNEAAGFHPMKHDLIARVPGEEQVDVRAMLEIHRKDIRLRNPLTEPEIGKGHLHWKWPREGIVRCTADDPYFEGRVLKRELKLSIEILRNYKILEDDVLYRKKKKKDSSVEISRRPNETPEHKRKRKFQNGFFVANSVHDAFKALKEKINENAGDEGTHGQLVVGGIFRQFGWQLGMWRKAAQNPNPVGSPLGSWHLTGRAFDIDIWNLNLVHSDELEYFQPGELAQFEKEQNGKRLDRLGTREEWQNRVNGGANYKYVEDPEDRIAANYFFQNIEAFRNIAYGMGFRTAGFSYIPWPFNGCAPELRRGKCNDRYRREGKITAAKAKEYRLAFSVPSSYADKLPLNTPFAFDSATLTNLKLEGGALKLNGEQIVDGCLERVTAKANGTERLQYALSKMKKNELDETAPPDVCYGGEVDGEDREVWQAALAWVSTVAPREKTSLRVMPEYQLPIERKVQAMWYQFLLKKLGLYKNSKGRVLDVDGGWGGGSKSSLDKFRSLHLKDWKKRGCREGVPDAQTLRVLEEEALGQRPDYYPPEELKLKARVEGDAITARALEDLLAAPDAEQAKFAIRLNSTVSSLAGGYLCSSDGGEVVLDAEFKLKPFDDMAIWPICPIEGIEIDYDEGVLIRRGSKEKRKDFLVRPFPPDGSHYLQNWAELGASSAISFTVSLPEVQEQIPEFVLDYDFENGVPIYLSVRITDTRQSQEFTRNSRVEIADEGVGALPKELKWPAFASVGRKEVKQLRRRPNFRKMGGEKHHYEYPYQKKETDQGAEAGPAKYFDYEEPGFELEKWRQEANGKIAEHKKRLGKLLDKWKRDNRAKVTQEHVYLRFRSIIKGATMGPLSKSRAEIYWAARYMGNLPTPEALEGYLALVYQDAAKAMEDVTPASGGKTVETIKRAQTLLSYLPKSACKGRTKVTEEGVFFEGKIDGNEDSEEWKTVISTFQTRTFGKWEKIEIAGVKKRQNYLKTYKGFLDAAAARRIELCWYEFMLRRLYRRHEKGALTDERQAYKVNKYQVSGVEKSLRVPIYDFQMDHFQDGWKEPSKKKFPEDAAVFRKLEDVYVKQMDEQLRLSEAILGRLPASVLRKVPTAKLLKEDARVFPEWKMPTTESPWQIALRAFGNAAAISDLFPPTAGQWEDALRRFQKGLRAPQHGQWNPRTERRILHCWYQFLMSQIPRRKRAEPYADFLKRARADIEEKGLPSKSYYMRLRVDGGFGGKSKTALRNFRVGFKDLFENYWEAMPREPKVKEPMGKQSSLARSPSRSARHVLEKVYLELRLEQTSNDGEGGSGDA